MNKIDNFVLVIILYIRRNYTLLYYCSVGMTFLVTITTASIIKVHIKIESL